MQILTFTLNGFSFGILLEDVVFIGSSVNVVEMPGASAHVRGFAALRGEIVPVYNLASRFGYAKQGMKYLVVVNAGGMKVALEVDAIENVSDVEKDVVAPLPGMIKTAQQCFRNAVSRAKGIIILIDVKRLVPKEEKEELCHLIEEKTVENGSEKDIPEDGEDNGKTEELYT